MSYLRKLERDEEEEVSKGGYAQNDEFRGVLRGFFYWFCGLVLWPCLIQHREIILREPETFPSFLQALFLPFPHRVWWRIALRENLPWGRISSWICRNWGWNQEIKKGKCSRTTKPHHRIPKSQGHIQRLSISSPCSWLRVSWGISLSWD